MKRHPFQHTLDRTSIHWQAYIGIRKNSGMGMGVGYIPIPEPEPVPVLFFIRPFFKDYNG